MKKTIAIFLTVLLALTMGMSAFAEETSGQSDSLVVANATKLSGYFFTELWGNNTSDQDVRAMLHGLETVTWTEEPQFDINNTVVKSVKDLAYKNGDRSMHIELNENLRYSDGTEITAADYVFSILLQASPELKELGASEGAYKWVYGYEAYHNGEKDTFEGVNIIDKYTFALHVRKDALPYFYQNALIRVYPYPISEILPGCEVENTSRGARIKGEYNAQTLEDTLFNVIDGYASHPSVVSGPYKLVSYDAESGEARFEKNEYFPGNYQNQTANIEKVTLKWANPDTIVDEMKAGEVDLLDKVVSREQMKALTDAGLTRELYARRGYGYLSFACEDDRVCADQKVRQAIAYAVDAETFIDQYFGSYGYPVYSYYGQGQWMVGVVNGIVTPKQMTANEAKRLGELTLDNLNHYDFDLEKAKSLLDEAGWNLNAEGGEYESGVRYRKVNDELQPLEIRWAKTSDGKAADALAGIIAPAFEEIGIQLTITEMPFTQVLNQYYRLEEREYDMFFLATNFADVFDPSKTFSPDESDQGVNNTTGIVDEKLYQLAVDMARVKPLEFVTYLEKWQAFQEYYNEVLPTVPIYSDVYADFIG
ncbi:MAG: ABC transporter substrate-binding protein, partial [Clostridia bacterium]|nr:ABC transporter substrate-binding protein [Clostridia bacterium]